MLHAEEIGGFEPFNMSDNAVIGESLELWLNVHDRSGGLRRERTQRAGEIGDRLSMLMVGMMGMKQVRRGGEQNNATAGDGENRCCAFCFRPHRAVLPWKNTLGWR
jgi:hypothetical protein